MVRGHSYGAQWHFHPEHQLTLVLKSHGHRVVGDNITPLAPGDLVLVGGNVPHVWHQDEGGMAASEGVHAIVVRFREDFLGRDFLHTPEMEPVRALLKRAVSWTAGAGKDTANCGDTHGEARHTAGLGRVIGFLAILDELRSRKICAPFRALDSVLN